ncbi:hypothetical protein BDV37DRAFT_289428 [Aspergillus pseudonomiae]|uniref:Uncharacterized protein n=1 Tax=Aspergillus pseudonomiae TaxID=1506151 RepID=A0A5N7CTE3_9EURO|nr:uncharacterized protein BDV37DRAFT_289428 [Aspergillus pseudonomiae]KAE8397435.1 hypothetical protein BDV37DRAFT_289428 [Aspergillus pseudonomiae]
MEKGNPEAKGYGPFRHTLEVSKVKDCYWDKQSGEGEVGWSSRATAEVSGGMAATPVDVSVQMKRSTSSTGSAASPHYRLGGAQYKLKNPFKHEMMDWVDENTAKIYQALASSPRDRRSWADRDYGCLVHR